MCSTIGARFCFGYMVLRGLELVTIRGHIQNRTTQTRYSVCVVHREIMIAIIKVKGIKVWQETMIKEYYNIFIL